MLDLAQTLSDKTVEIYGVDLTSRLFPSTHPSNLHFSTHSITSLPAEWSSKYAFVHQRLLMGALTKEMWTSAIVETFRVLKPGGWIELQEHKESKFPHAGPNSIKMESILRGVWQKQSLVGNLKETLLGILEDAGFVNVECVEFITPFENSEFENGTNVIGVMVALKAPVLKSGGFGIVTTEDEYDALIAGMRQEWKKTDGGMTYVEIFAQKPLAS